MKNFNLKSDVIVVGDFIKSKHKVINNVKPGTWICGFSTQGDKLKSLWISNFESWAKDEDIKHKIQKGLGLVKIPQIIDIQSGKFCFSSSTNNDEFINFILNSNSMFGVFRNGVYGSCTNGEYLLNSIKDETGLNVAFYVEFIADSYIDEFDDEEDSENGEEA